MAAPATVAAAVPFSRRPVLEALVRRVFLCKRADEIIAGDMVRQPLRALLIGDVSHDACTGASVMLTASMVRYPGDGYSPAFTCSTILTAYPGDLVLVTERGRA